MRPAFNPDTPTWKVFLLFLVGAQGTRFRCQIGFHIPARDSTHRPA